MSKTARSCPDISNERPCPPFATGASPTGACSTRAGSRARCGRSTARARRRASSAARCATSRWARRWAISISPPPRLPEVVMKRARAAGFGVAPTGLAHGTVTLIVEGQPIEVTTLRRDVATDGRHATVAFGRDFAADARRRDFTINALSLGRDGVVHDYVGGLADLAARRVRFIGDASQRIREDYLRILRFFRFSARYGDGRARRRGLARGDPRARRSGDPVARAGARRAAQAAGGAARRRSRRPRFARPACSARCSPGRPTRRASARSRRSRRAATSGPDALLRLAALGVRIEEDAERLRERLRLSNAEFERLAILGQALPILHGLSAPPPFAALARGCCSSAGGAARSTRSRWSTPTAARRLTTGASSAPIASSPRRPEPTPADHRRRHRGARRRARPTRRRDAENAAGVVDSRRLPARAGSRWRGCSTRR